jgi:hypothetical protein
MLIIPKPGVHSSHLLQRRLITARQQHSRENKEAAMKSAAPINFFNASKLFRQAMAISVLALLTACSSIPTPQHATTQTDARALLDQTQAAHGKDAFLAIRDLSVSYDGKWFELVTRIQPVLTDKTFRKASEERMIFTPNVIAQMHTGDAGKKMVLRDGSLPLGERASVWLNQHPESNREKISAAHLVVEAYQLFLYPAFYVERASYLERIGTDSVGGRECELLLAVVRPGIGNSAEDRVVLYIDKQDKLVKRVRLTLEGLDSTKGAVVDVDHDRFVEIAGVTWPTHFYEALVKPFPGLPAHDFSLRGLDVNRGLTKADFANAQFSERAAKPAAAIATLPR